MGTQAGIQAAMMPEDCSIMQTTVSHVMLTVIALGTVTDKPKGFDHT